MLTRILRQVIRAVTEDHWNGWLYVFEPSQKAPAADIIFCRAIEDVTEILLSQTTNSEFKPYLKRKTPGYSGRG